MTVPCMLLWKKWGSHLWNNHHIEYDFYFLLTSVFKSKHLAEMSISITLTRILFLLNLNTVTHKQNWDGYVDLLSVGPSRMLSSFQFVSVGPSWMLYRFQFKSVFFLCKMGHITFYIVSKPLSNYSSKIHNASVY